MISSDAVGGGDDGARTREPPACKAGALPTELHPHGLLRVLLSKNPEN